MKLKLSRKSKLGLLIAIFLILAAVGVYYVFWGHPGNKEAAESNALQALETASVTE